MYEGGDSEMTVAENGEATTSSDCIWERKQGVHSVNAVDTRRVWIWEKEEANESTYC